MLAPAMTEVHLYKDYGYGALVLQEKFYKGPWEDTCRKINFYNDLYVKGSLDYITRAFCPWTGEELYIPKDKDIK